MTTRHEKLLVLLLLAGYAAILVWNAGRVGLTLDEPTRLLGAQLYWSNLPDHHPKDQPPLMSIATGWAPLAAGMPLMRDDIIWQVAWKDHVSSRILDLLPGEQIGRIFFLARLGVIPFALATAGLLWHWSRRLFGPATALLVLTLFLLLPESRAHGALITSDMAATFTYLLSAWLAWRYWIEPGWGSACWLGLAAGLALTAKFSLLIVPPLAAAVVIAAGVRGWRSVAQAAAHAAMVLGLALLVMIAAYKFDTRRLTPVDLNDMAARREFPPALLYAARVFQYIPTPAEAQEGVRAMMRYQHEGSPAYLLGTYYSTGHWAYYPVCLALKTPIGFQVLVLAGLAMLIGIPALTGRGYQKDGALKGRGYWGKEAAPGPGSKLAPHVEGRIVRASRLFLLLPGLIYLAFSMHNSIQLGIRLILPVFPFLLLTAGYAIDRWRQQRAGRVLLAILFLAAGISVARVFPHDLSYFNEWARGPEDGWRYLSDSNIDWGHNLPELARWTAEHNVKHLRFFHFGFDKPHRYFAPGVLDPQPLPWSADPGLPTVYVPQPGLYAVHVSLLGGQYFPPAYRDYLRYFRERPPDGRAGYGIFIYRIGEPDEAPAGS